MWDPNPYSVTPAAKVLARCVTSGTMTQKELDALPREPEVFSPRLREAEQLNRIKHEIDQLFTSHLQDVLREQTSLRQRLMKPLCQQNLPLQADLHRYVFELMGMVVKFLENLEMKIKMVRSIPTTDESLSNLNNAMTQLLTQVTEVESLTKQLLQRRETSKDDIKDMSS